MSSSKHVGGKARLPLKREAKTIVAATNKTINLNHDWLFTQFLTDARPQCKSRKNTQQIRCCTGLHNTTKDTAGSATLHCSRVDAFSYFPVKSVDFRAWEQNPCRPAHEDSDVTQQLHCEKLRSGSHLWAETKQRKRETQWEMVGCWSFRISWSKVLSCVGALTNSGQTLESELRNYCMKMSYSQTLFQTIDTVFKKNNKKKQLQLDN